MIQEKIQAFLTKFPIDGRYTVLGLSKELLYFLDILRKNQIEMVPCYFSDPEISQETAGRLSEKYRIVADPTAKACLDAFSNITLLPLDNIPSDTKIIITSDMYRNELVKILLAKGLVRDKDFCLYKDALAYWSYAVMKNNYIHRIDQFVTSRCTLNCTHCNMYIPHFKDPKDRGLEELKSEADLFFSKIDTLGIFHLVGGEPLLNRSLEDYVEYLGTTYYGKRFHNFWITSNGTVAPSARLRELFKRFNVFVSVTDYSAVLPHIANKTKRSLAIYGESGVNFLHNVEKSWIDFGDPRVVYETDESKLKRHFQRCTVPYRGIAGNRFYYCNLSVGADESGAKAAQPGDYIEITKELDPLDMIQFDLGTVPRGYLTLCESCSGCNTGVGEEVAAGASQGLR